jgi:hypothetical protein
MILDKALHDLFRATEPQIVVGLAELADDLCDVLVGDLRNPSPRRLVRGVSAAALNALQNKEIQPGMQWLRLISRPWGNPVDKIAPYGIY